MADSYNFIFRVTNRFWRDFNREFDVNNMTGANSDVYKILLCSQLPSDIDNVIDEYGYLVDSNEVNGFDYLDTPELTTTYLNATFTQGGFLITMAGESTVNITLNDSNNYLNGILIVRHQSTDEEHEGYLLAYARSPQPILVKDIITIPTDTELIGLGTCNG